MKTNTLIRSFTGLMLICLTACGLSPTYAADLSLHGGVFLPSNNQLEAQPFIKAKLAKEDAYAFVQYSQGMYRKSFQDFSNMSMFTVGVGGQLPLSPRVKLFSEVGVGYLDHQMKPVIAKEGIYFDFLPTFGHPPFLSAPGVFNASELEYEYKASLAYTISFGVSYQVTDRDTMEVSYQLGQFTEKFAIYNPSWGGGLAAGRSGCGCLWEGENSVDIGGVSFSLSHKF